MGAKEEVVAGDEGWVTNCDCASDEVEVDDVCSDMLGSWAAGQGQLPLLSASCHCRRIDGLEVS